MLLILSIYLFCLQVRLVSLEIMEAKDLVEMMGHQVKREAMGHLAGLVSKVHKVEKDYHVQGR